MCSNDNQFHKFSEPPKAYVHQAAEPKGWPVEHITFYLVEDIMFHCFHRPEPLYLRRKESEVVGIVPNLVTISILSGRYIKKYVTQLFIWKVFKPVRGINRRVDRFQRRFLTHRNVRSVERLSKSMMSRKDQRTCSGASRSNADWWCSLQFVCIEYSVETSRFPSTVEWESTITYLDHWSWGAKRK